MEVELDEVKRCFREEEKRKGNVEMERDEMEKRSSELQIELER